MHDIGALAQRIASALDRIGTRLDTAPGQAAVAAEAGVPSLLQTQLDEERALTLRLQKALRISKEREAKGDTDAKLDRLTHELDVQGLELQRMRRVNLALVQQVEVLREAQMANATEPQLINKAMMIELDALRALRMSEMAEMDEILAALEPHLTEADDARA